MVVATGAVIVTVASAGAAAPAAVAAGTATAGAAGVTTGVVVGGIFGGIAAAANIISGTSAVTSSGIAGAAFGTIGGSVTGSIAGSTATGAVVSGTVGALTAAAISSNTAGATGLATVGFLAGPIGMCILGADVVNYTFDCWKKVVRDTSPEPSDGKVLYEFVKDERIKHLHVNSDTNSSYPEVTIVNVWDEHFLIEFYYLPLLDKIAAHAKPIDSSTKNLII